jgi:hypothetical protein
VNAGQYEGLMARLGQILDRMPERPATEPAQPFTVHHMDGSKTVTTNKSDGNKTGWPYDRYGPAPVPTLMTQPHDVPVGTVRVAGATIRDGAQVALSRMLDMLDGWIEIARENHNGLGHRGENRGEECWTQFHPVDIRRMVNDVARELGLTEFPEPAKPKEDEAR